MGYGRCVVTALTAANYLFKSTLAVRSASATHDHSLFDIFLEVCSAWLLYASPLVDLSAYPRHLSPHHVTKDPLKNPDI